MIVMFLKVNCSRLIRRPVVRETFIGLLLAHSSFFAFIVIPHTFHIHSFLFLSPVPFPQREVAGPRSISQADLFSFFNKHLLSPSLYTEIGWVPKKQHHECMITITDTPSAKVGNEGKKRNSNKQAEHGLKTRHCGSLVTTARYWARGHEFVSSRSDRTRQGVKVNTQASVTVHLGVQPWHVKPQFEFLEWANTKTTFGAELIRRASPFGLEMVNPHIPFFSSLV